MRWALACMELEDTVEQLEARLSPVLVRRLQEKLWQALYYGYDFEKEFLPQLEQNLQRLAGECRKLTAYQEKLRNQSK